MFGRSISRQATTFRRNLRTNLSLGFRIQSRNFASTVSLMDIGNPNGDSNGVKAFFTPRNDSFPYEKVYGPLDPNNKEIRLVSILPGTSEMVSCKLINSVSLKEPKHSYETISYCAGDPADNATIFLQGEEFNVFQNLYDAILCFRLSDKERIMWIDQICINQTDIPERDSQVLQMGDIYEKAQSTHVWLGTATNLTKPGFNLISEFLSEHRESLRSAIMSFNNYDQCYLQSKRKLLKLFDEPLSDYLESEQMWFEAMISLSSAEDRAGGKKGSVMKACAWLEAKGSDSSKTREWEGLHEILRRPWWRRCWTYQEAVLSNNICIHLGSNTMNWEDLSLLVNVITCADYLWANEIPMSGALRESSMACYRIAASRRSSLPHSALFELDTTQNSIASDPRDKVYSVLGLLDRESREAFAVKPNYSQSNTKRNVYIATAKAIIQTHADWDLLASVSGHELEVNLPSWAPDWVQPTQGPISEEYGVRFHAASTLRAPVEFLEDDEVIKTLGSIVGHVEFLGDCASDPAKRDAHQLMNSWFELAMITRGPSALTIEQFGQTLFMGLLPEEEIPNSDGEYFTFFQYWLRRLTGRVEGTNGQKLIAIRRFFIFANRMCLGPLRTQLGDAICLLPGGAVPYLLRRSTKSPGRYNLVGECFVLGLMEGEIVEMWRQRTVDLTNIYLE